jgi:hypothetical protein
MRLNAIGLLFGVAFAYVLGWARLTDYDVMRNMLLPREPDVFLIMISVAAQLGRGQFAALFTIAGLATGILVCDRVRLRGTHAGRTEPLRDTVSAVGL